MNDVEILQEIDDEDVIIGAASLGKIEQFESIPALCKRYNAGFNLSVEFSDYNESKVKNFLRDKLGEEIKIVY